MRCAIVFASFLRSLKEENGSVSPEQSTVSADDLPTRATTESDERFLA